MDLKKLQNIDRRIIYVLLILVTAVPMIRPLAIPLTVNPGTEKFYDIINSIPAGERVLLSLDYSVGGSPDVHPQAVAIVKHLVEKGVGVVFISFWDVGPMFGVQLIRPYENEGYEYGVHFANLGYIPGGESAIKRFGEDVAGQVTRDFRNNDVSSLPIMQGVKDTRDFAAVICFSSGDPGVQEWVRQVQGPLGITLLAGAVTVNVPQYMPFVNAGQVQAMLAGLRGAAEYETIMGNPGPAVAKMDAQSLGHVVIILFILIGNLAYFLDRKEN
ncbi:MAG: hypothetical protein GX033_04535 [Firmicutes bacterium]|nr:hypothetical protein [Bacillota bacterium]